MTCNWMAIRWMGAGCVAAIALGGCPGDDGDGDSGADGSATSTTAASEGGPTGTPTDDGGDATSAAGGTMGGGSTTGSAGSDETMGASDSGGVVACAMSTCDPGNVCVHPCGGGAMPACQPALPDGGCARGFQPDNDGACPDPCKGGSCCAPIPEDLTPFCVDAEQLACDRMFCEVRGCIFGELQGDQLICGCPP